MKRLFSLLLAVLFLLSLAACKGKDKPAEPTAAPTALPPGVTQDPYPTQDPARAAFDPDTDFDNRLSGVMHAMIETEDAYYLTSDTAFIYYGDKSSGDQGVLCPRPECMHDHSNTRDELWACSGCIGSVYLTLYEGKLWWITYDNKAWQLYREEPDGTGREHVRSIAFPAGRDQPQAFYIHRGKLYVVIYGPMVVDSSPTNYLSVAVMPLLEDGFTELLYRQSYTTPQTALQFIGDDVYIIAGVDNSNESIYEGDPDSPLPLGKIMYENLILRWNQYMEVPQVLHVDEDIAMINSQVFWVGQDGTVWFERMRPLTPELDWWEEGFRWNQILCRLDPEGIVTELFDCQIEGESYFFQRIADGVLLCVKSLLETKDRLDVCIRDLDGNVICRGELPMAYRERTVPGSRWSYFNDIVLRGDHFIISMRENTEFDKNYPSRTYFIRYDFGPDGFKETFLAEGMIVILSR